MAELDDALLAFLETLSGRRPLSFDRPLRPLSGGFWAEISAFSLADAPSHFAGELVLRRVPDPRRGRIEAAVQGTLAELGFPSPRVRASGGPDDGLGRAFLIMDRARGRSLERSRSRREAVRRSLAYPRVCAEVMLRLHAMPPEPVIARLAAAASTRASCRSTPYSRRRISSPQRSAIQSSRARSKCSCARGRPSAPGCCVIAT